MENNGIVASDVARHFGSVQAVKSITLEVPPGQVTALVGPNGAGKTTLLLMLATLLVPDRGKISIAGYDPVKEPREVRAKMGWFPDVFGMYDSLTVREYLEIFAKAYRLKGSHIIGRCMELLVRARLAEYADQPVHVLSRGQKQRLGLARTLIHQPSVLLLDEPASGLDPRSRVELRELLRELASNGAAVLISSHILSDLEEVADRVVFINNGSTVGQHNLNALPTEQLIWKFTALDMAGLESALQNLDFQYKTSSSKDIEVTVNSEEKAAGLIKKLVDSGVQISAAVPVQSSLESTYLKLTEGQK